MSPHYQRAELLYEQSRHKEALQELQHHLREFPDDADAIGLKAHALALLERLDEALDAVAAAFEIAPDYGYVYRASAFVLYRSNRLKEAHAAVREAIRLDPNNYDYHRLQAIFWLNQNEFQEMLDSANRALALQPEDELSLNLQSIALRGLGQPLEAEQVALLSLNRNPEIAFSHFTRGWGLLESKDYVGAKKHFREALRLNPNSKSARKGLFAATKDAHFVTKLTYGIAQGVRESERGEAYSLIAWSLGCVFGLLLISVQDKLFPNDLLILYGTFLVRLAMPLFFSLLRLTDDGRRLLNRRQKLCARNLIACLIASTSFGFLYVLTESRWMIDGMVLSLCLAIPATDIYNVRRGWPRFTMAVWTTVLATGLAAHIVLQAFAISMPSASAKVSSNPSNTTQREASSQVFPRLLLFGCMCLFWAPYAFPVREEAEDADVRLS
nr:tetratricopeptide repeat protein [Rubinisphaera sp. JC750]